MRDGPRGFGQGFTCPALLRVPPVPARPTRTGLSPATAPLSSGFRFARLHLMAALQPRPRRNGAGLGCSPFARRYLGNHSCFLLLRVLRCFSSPGLPPDRSGCRAFRAAGCPIRTPADRWVCAPPRGFSQLVASFFASESLGIPRAPLITSRALARPVFARSLLLLRNKSISTIVVYNKICVYSHHHHVKERSPALPEEPALRNCTASNRHPPGMLAGGPAPWAEILFVIKLSLAGLESLPQRSWRITDSNR